MTQALTNSWTATQLEAAARAHLLSPAEEMAKLGESARPVLSHGEGIYVVDARGNKLIDGPGGMWCTQVGYGRTEIAEAMAQQALRLSYNSPWYTTNDPAIRLAHRIAESTPGDLKHVFFTGGGSTAVDSALRFVQFYNNVLGRHDKKIVLCRIDGYHGSTHLTAACSGRKGNWKNFDLNIDTVSFLSSPKLYKNDLFSDEATFTKFLLDEAEERILTLGADRVAALLAEPIQASGGVIVPPAGYLKGLRDLCTKYDMLYISDEVVTAFGRCGHWFASEEMFGVSPDIITFAKGVTSGYVPLGGFAISDKVLQRVSGAAAKESYFSNGYTYTGHPVSCAAALANIELMERENLLAHVQDISPYFQEKLRELKSFKIVGDVRGLGLLGCVECTLGDSRPETAHVEATLGQKIDEKCLQLGLIVRPIGNMCVFSPPLIISKDQIDTMVSILATALESTQNDLVRSGLL